MSIESFWKYVQGGKPDKCWLWTGPLWTVGGYGRWKKKRAHREIWEQTNGPIPPGLLVCHHCDRPSCVNPVHLFLGTHRDNSQDASKKNRLARLRGDLNGARIHRDRLPRGGQHWTARRPDLIARGDRHGGRKLILQGQKHFNDRSTPELIARVLSLRSKGQSYESIGDKLSITTMRAWRIVKTHSFIPGGQL